MHMILHHLKVALRNLMKYKLQTFISVLIIMERVRTDYEARRLLQR